MNHSEGMLINPRDMGEIAEVAPRMNSASDKEIGERGSVLASATNVDPPPPPNMAMEDR